MRVKKGSWFIAKLNDIPKKEFLFYRPPNCFCKLEEYINLGRNMVYVKYIPAGRRNNQCAYYAISIPDIKTISSYRTYFINESQIYNTLRSFKNCVINEVEIELEKEFEIDISNSVSWYTCAECRQS